MQKLKKDSRNVMIVAAEASSSLYAQRLLEYWRQEGEDVKAFGIGSQSMVDLGFEAIGRSEDLAIMGLQEVVAHFPLIYKTFKALVSAAKERKPSFVLLLDYPDFNLRLAKKLKALGIPVIYYISPQIWAWRQSRVHTIKKSVDHMLVLFPFEKEFYEKNEMKVDFVGHPLLDEISQKYFESEYQNELRIKHNLKAGSVLALMPGSRKSEVQHHLKDQLLAAEKIVEKYPETQVCLLLAPGLSQDDVKAYLDQSEIWVHVVQDDPMNMIALADDVLVASGTATLMVGLLEKPMVVIYKMNAFTAKAAKLLVKHITSFAMVNLILQKRAVTELFQQEATPERMAVEITKLREVGVRHAIGQDLKELKLKLGAKGATMRVAKILSQYW